MSLFRFFRSAKTGSKRKTISRAKLQLEALEDRFLPTGNIISGFVYVDANNNGIKEANEAPVIGSTLQLVNSSNQVVATATTDANGYYQFNSDNTINQTPTTLTKTVTFNRTQTNFNGVGLLDQFDPSLGQLQSVKIIHNGTLESTIRVENTSNISQNEITATVSGSLTLNGPNFSLPIQFNTNVGTRTFPQFDGTIDFAGPSGFNFGTFTVTDSKDTLLLTNLQAFIGTGTVSLTENGVATSTATGGGNLSVALESYGSSSVTVIYTYIPTNNLKPGDYVIKQIPQPQGLLDGKETRNGTPVNNPVNVDVIPVTLVSSDLPNNNFGELQPASISGFVFHDQNNDGIRGPGDVVIPGVTLTLSGTDDFGPITPRTVTTSTIDPTKAYEFTNLRPGTYTITETQPGDYLDGKVTAGTVLGATRGAAGTNTISTIAINSGDVGSTYNFGEYKGSTVSGYVFNDRDNGNNRGPGEEGIANVQVTLTQFTQAGPLAQTVSTDATGFYQFTNLAPGSYTISESQPSGWLDGKDYIGSQTGTSGADQFSFSLTSGTTGQNNNFGELTPGGIRGLVWNDQNNNGSIDSGETMMGSVTVTLSGVDDLGPIAPRTVTTSNNAADKGQYAFTDLRPGTYTISETQPAGYRSGQNQLGTINTLTSGTLNSDIFTVTLPIGGQGINYNFAEILVENADLKIVKTASAPSVLVGTNLSYTLTVSNLGPNTANSVTVTDNLPAEVTFVSALAPGWTTSQNGQTLTFTTASVPVGINSVITITVRAPSFVTNVTNNTSVTSNTPDPNPSNNTSTVTVTVYSDPGGELPKTIPPLVTTLNLPPVIVSKNQLISSDGWMYIDANTRAQLTFIDGLYRTLLGRAGTQSEIMYNLQQLQSGMSRAQLVTAFWFTDAHFSNAASQIYQALLNRAPTSSELASAVSLLKTGTNELELVLNVVASADYQAAHPTSTSLVLGLYADLLGVVPDSTSQLATLQAMGTQDVRTVAAQLLYSNSGLAQFVDYGYRNILGRPATAAEIQYWTPLLQNKSITVGQLMETLLASDEFFARAWANARPA